MEPLIVPRVTTRRIVLRKFVPLRNLNASQAMCAFQKFGNVMATLTVSMEVMRKIAPSELVLKLNGDAAPVDVFHHHG